MALNRTHWHIFVINYFVFTVTAAFSAQQPFERLPTGNAKGTNFEANSKRILLCFDLILFFRRCSTQFKRNRLLEEVIFKLRTHTHVDGLWACMFSQLKFSEFSRRKIQSFLKNFSQTHTAAGVFKEKFLLHHQPQSRFPSLLHWAPDHKRNSIISTKINNLEGFFLIGKFSHHFTVGCISCCLLCVQHELAHDLRRHAWSH